MFDYHAIIRLFCQNYDVIDDKEDFDNYIFSGTTNKLALGDKNKFDELARQCKYYNDKYLISIGLYNHDEPYRFHFIDYDYNDVEKQFELLNLLKDEDSVFKIELFIEKNVENKYLVVYNKKEFIQYLETIDLENIFVLIRDQLFKKNSHLVFANAPLNLSNDFLYLSDRHGLIHERIDFSKQLKKMKCQCRKIADSALMPRCYYFDTDVSDGVILFFNRLAIISSYCHLFSFVEIKGNKIFLQCNGYKEIHCEIDYKRIPSDQKIFVEISNWIYSSSGIEDKLGLFHNVLSLSINTNDDIFNIKRNFFDSLKSNYNIYLRENINQYLQVKSKFIEQQIKFVSEFHELADELVNNLKNNFIAFLSFFMTVVVLNALSTGKLDYLFNDTITTISFILLLISVFLLMLSIARIWFKWHRQERVINSLKDSYNDILNTGDINDIFDRNINMAEEKNYLITNTIIVAVIWLICLILIFVAIHYLNNKYHLRNFIFIVEVSSHA
jgi:hypothetical protein